MPRRTDPNPDAQAWDYFAPEHQIERILLEGGWVPVGENVRWMHMAPVATATLMLVLAWDEMSVETPDQVWSTTLIPASRIMGYSLRGSLEPYSATGGTTCDERQRSGSASAS